MHIGNHILADLYGVQADILANETKLRELIMKAAEEAAATLLELHSHKFSGGNGISVVAIIAESHISIHTYPEFSLAMLDIFTCGNKTMPEKALDYLTRQLQPERIVIHSHYRGEIRTGAVAKK